MTCLATALAGLLAVAPATGTAAAGGERHYLGTVDGRRALRMREATRSLPDGSRLTEIETTLTAGRSGEARQHARFVESAAGELLSFRLRAEGGGRVIRLEAHVERDERGGLVRGFVDRDGRRLPTAQEAPLGLPVVGPHGERRLLLGLQRAGEEVTYASPTLREGSLALVTRHGRRVIDAGGRRSFALTSPSSPFPSHVVLDHTGALLEAEWRLGQARAHLSPEGSSSVHGGRWLPRALRVPHRGGAPGPAGLARYAVPAALEPALAEDEFQRRTAPGEVRVTSNAPPSAPPASASLGAAEPGGIEEEPFRRFVAGQRFRAGDGPAAVMRRLRDAVRRRVRPAARGAIGTARAALEAGSGDCTEASDLLARALHVAGLSARVEIGLLFDTTTGHWEGHAWTAAYDPAARRWVHLDALYPDQPRSAYLKLGAGASTAEAIARSRLLEVAGAAGAEPIRTLAAGPGE